MTAEAIKVLLVEDDEDDVYLTRELLLEIREARYRLDWVDNFAEALQVIGSPLYDVCLIDYKLGPDSGVELLKQAIRMGCDTPLILMTAEGDRAVDMEAMKAGAADYLVKGRTNSALLERSIRYALDRKRAERERGELLRQLQEAMVQVKTLSGLLPICMTCKKIQDGQGNWEQLELYIREHSNAEFSHGLCPDCFGSHYPEYSTG